MTYGTVWLLVHLIGILYLLRIERGTTTKGAEE